MLFSTIQFNTLLDFFERIKGEFLTLLGDHTLIAIALLAVLALLILLFLRLLFCRQPKAIATFRSAEGKVWVSMRALKEADQ